MILLFGVMRAAQRAKWIAVSPCANIEHIERSISGAFNVLSDVELMAVARAAGNVQDATLVLVAGFCGLRMGELRALRWSEIDWTGSTVRVSENYTIGHTGPPKSGKVRSVPLIDQATAALDQLSKCSSFTAPGDLVFPTPAGDHRDDSEIRQMFYRALEAAGFGEKRRKDRRGGPMVFHDLRHTFGTLAVTVWPLVDVQSYMGHAHIDTTMIYAHHVPRTAAAAELSARVAADLTGTEAGTRIGGSSAFAVADVVQNPAIVSNRRS